jgi:hypothetical protein
MRREDENNVSAESSSVSSTSSIRAGLPSTPTIRVKFGDLSLIKETGGDYVPPSSLATYTTSLSRRILPSAPRERLTTHETHENPIRNTTRSPYKDPIKVPSEPSSSRTRRTEGGALPKQRRSSRENGKEAARPKVRDEGEDPSSRVELRDDSVQTEREEDSGKEEKIVNGEAGGQEDGSSPAPSSAQQQTKDATASHASVSTAIENETQSTLFNGFSRLDRKWFDDSGYNGCLDRLEELERVVEAQFEDLSSKGYDASSALLKDSSSTSYSFDKNKSPKDSPLRMEALDNLEKLVEQQHKDLVDKGVLPEDSIRIFTQP